jgi:hypothetical protein
MELRRSKSIAFMSIREFLLHFVEPRLRATAYGS